MLRKASELFLFVRRVECPRKNIAFYKYFTYMCFYLKKIHTFVGNKVVGFVKNFLKGINFITQTI